MSIDKIIKTLLFVGIVVFVSACGKHSLPGDVDVAGEDPTFTSVSEDEDGLPTEFVVINSYQGAGSN